METIQIILTVLVLLIVIYLIIWFFSRNTPLTKMSDGNIKQDISANSLPNSKHSNNFTYSMWIYVNDWNYRFGEQKIILGRLDKNNNPSPSISLDAMENNISVTVSCYPTKNNNDSKPPSANPPNLHTCSVSNIPLQKWVNLIVSLYGRTLDVYLDGKLVRTCVLPGVAMIDPAANVLITPNGGFNGWTTNFQYWASSSNPQEAYNIYKGGYGGSFLGNLFNKFNIKVSILSDNKERSSFVI